MTKTILIKIYDVRDTLLYSEAIKAYEPGKRMSAWSTAAQRRLDAMLTQHPTATRATIGSEVFIVRDGRSLFTHF